MSWLTCNPGSVTQAAALLGVEVVHERDQPDNGKCEPDLEIRQEVAFLHRQIMLQEDE